MIGRARRLSPLGTRGVAAIEFALVAPAFLFLIFGVIETGRLMWQQVSLQRATAIAARCGALATVGCISDLEIKTKAVRASAGSGLTAAKVTVSRVTCGVKVSATRQFHVALRLPITLTAQACHPIVK